jgi:hypothetical protein
MMLPKKPPKRLFRSKDVIHSYQHDRSARSRMKQMSRNYEDVLQNVEIALVGPAHQDPTIDDRMIDEALQISTNCTTPGHRQPGRSAVATAGGDKGVA